MFHVIHLGIPSVEWIDFPSVSMRIREYSVQQSSGDTCRALCASMALCGAADYDTREGKCWIYFERECKGNGVKVNSVMYHMKKSNIGYCQ